MHRKISLATLPVALALAAGFSITSGNSALANGFSTDTKSLPDASNIYRSKLKLQIVDESPEVKDVRHPKENTVYQINVPPMPQSTTHVVQIGDPSSAAGANGAGGSGNSVPITQQGLPFAGSRSNIGPHQSLANQLPNGTSTQALHCTLAKKPAQSNPVAQTAAPMAKLPATVRPTAVASYPTTTSSGGGVSQNQIAKTSAIGSLLHPEKSK